MFTTMALLVAIVALTSGEEDKLVQLVKDAHVTNLARLQSGTIRANVRFAQYPGPDKAREVKLDILEQWDGANVFWSYRRTDPSGLLTDAKSKTGGESHGPDYFIKTIKQTYYYSSDVNQIFVKDIKTIRPTPFLLRLLDVSPSGCWYRCFPPAGSEGIPWSENIGPKARTMKEGSVFSMRQMGPNRIVQTRTDPDGGLSEATFATDFGCNVISNRYRGATKRARSRTVNYEWAKAKGGVFVLKSCEVIESSPGRPESVFSRYRLEISLVDTDPPAGGVFTLENLLGLVPKNVVVSDSVRRKSYAPFGKTAPSDVELDALSKELRSQGLLNK